MGIKKLIQHCKKGDLKAQEELFRLFSPKLFAVSLKYSRNYQEAEDNLQDAFITIYQKIGQFKHKGSFEGWLKRITINTALQRYRQQSVFSLVNEGNLEQPETVHLREENVSLDFLLELIQGLPNRYRLVFNLYVLDGYSHKEIAKMLEISVGTSKSNLARARKNLREKLEASEKLKNTRSIK